VGFGELGNVGGNVVEGVVLKTKCEKGQMGDRAIVGRCPVEVGDLELLVQDGDWDAALGDDGGRDVGVSGASIKQRHEGCTRTE
jgi:hypothetical protein